MSVVPSQRNSDLQRQIEALWHVVCGTIGRRSADASRVTAVKPYSLPPPYLCLLPSTIPGPRNNASLCPQRLSGLRIVQAFNDYFRYRPDEVNFVSFDFAHQSTNTVTTTRIVRDGEVQGGSDPMAIRRS